MTRVVHMALKKVALPHDHAAHLNDGVDRGERVAVDTGPHNVGQSVHLALVHPVALQQASVRHSSRGGAAETSTRTCCT